jgi:hypothetical protein
MHDHDHLRTQIATSKTAKDYATSSAGGPWRGVCDRARPSEPCGEDVSAGSHPGVLARIGRRSGQDQRQTNWHTRHGCAALLGPTRMKFCYRDMQTIAGGSCQAGVRRRAKVRPKLDSEKSWKRRAERCRSSTRWVSPAVGLGWRGIPMAIATRSGAEVRRRTGRRHSRNLSYGSFASIENIA